MQTCLKPEVPKRITILEKSSYDIAQLQSDRCQPLKPRVLSAMHSSSQNQTNVHLHRKKGFIAKPFKEEDVLEMYEKQSQISKNEQNHSPAKVGQIDPAIHSQPEDKGNTKQQSSNVAELSTEKFPSEKESSPNKLQGDIKFKKIERIDSGKGKKTQKNIFDNAKLFRNGNSDEEDIGVRTFQGRIVPYSLAGRVEWFERELEKEKNLHKSSKESVCSDETQMKNIKEVSELIRLQTQSKQQCHQDHSNNQKGSIPSVKDVKINCMENTRLFPVPWQQQADKTFVSDVKFKRRKEKQRALEQMKRETEMMYLERDLTGEEVTAKVEEEEMRLKDNKTKRERENEGALGLLTYGERNALTRQGRVIAKQEKQAQLFEERVFQQSLLLRRQMDQSLLQTGENYARKMEARRLLESLQNQDTERQVGENFWENNLRKHSHKGSAVHPQEWIPNTNEREKKDVLSLEDQSEITGKGNQTYLSSELAYRKNRAFSVQLKKQLLEQSFATHANDPNQIRKQSLVVQGQNKFENEKYSLLNATVNKLQNSFKERTLRKYSLNRSFQNYQSNQSAFPQIDSGMSSESSFLQINNNFLAALKDNDQTVSPCEEAGISSEEVIHAAWDDRKILVKTGQLIFKKMALNV